MPNIFHQSVEDILKSATPEQRLQWNYIFLRFGERISISQLVTYGAFTGTELLTYSANKIYLAYDLYVEGISNSALIAQNITLYDETNAIWTVINQNRIIWDTTAAAIRYIVPSYNLTNILFSRLVVPGGSRGRFIGYRIGI